MSSFKGLFLAAACVALFAHAASATSLYFDFGYDDRTSAANNYNDVVIDGVGGGRPQPIAVPNLIDSTGTNTGISLSASGFFHGGNGNGTQSPTGDGAMFVPSATRDNAFTHVSQWGADATNPRAALVLSGLNNSTAYDFTFFASRMGVGDNRETMYTVTGSTAGVSYLDASNNESNVALVSGIYPDAGSITINFEAGPNNNNVTNGQNTRFAYLGAMKVEFAAVPEPTTLGLLGLSGMGLIFRRRFI